MSGEEKSSTYEMARPGESGGDTESASRDAEEAPLLAKDPKCLKSKGYRVLTDAKLRSHVHHMLLIIMFFDLIGPLILSVGEPAMVTAGVKLDANATPFPFPGQGFPQIPFGWSLSKSLLSSATLVGTSVCEAVFVPLSDRTGRKPIMLLFTFGGAVLFIVIGLVAVRDVCGDATYWAYIALKVAIGFVGGSKTMVSILLQDLFTNPVEKIKKVNMLMPIALIGAAVGALIGSVAVSFSKRLNIGAFVAAGLSIVGGLIVLFEVPEPQVERGAKKKKKKKKDAAKVASADDVEAQKPDFEAKVFPTKLYRHILAAKIFDDLGTQGLACAVSLVLYDRFVRFQTQPSESATVGFGTIFAVVIGLAMAIPSLGKRGAGFNATFGNFSTMVAQIVLIFMNTVPGYLVFLYLGYACSFFSTVSYMPMLITISTPETRAKVMSMYGVTGSLVNAFMPIICSVVIDYSSSTVALSMCASFSLIGTILSIGLMKRFPRPSPKIVLTDEEEAHIKNDDNWLSQEELDARNMKRIKAGEALINLKWGRYEDDEKWLPLMRKLARKDVMYTRKRIARTIDMLDAGGPAAAEYETKVRATVKKTMAEMDSGALDDDASEMGRWLASMMNEHGYVGWRTNPHLYKTIFTSIFPRLPRLDRNEAGLKTTLQNIQMFVSSILSMDLEQKRHHPTWESAAHRSIAI